MPAPCPYALKVELDQQVRDLRAMMCQLMLMQSRVETAPARANVVANAEYQDLLSKYSELAVRKEEDIRIHTDRMASLHAAFAAEMARVGLAHAAAIDAVVEKLEAARQAHAHDTNKLAEYRRAIQANADVACAVKIERMEAKLSKADALAEQLKMDLEAFQKQASTDKDLCRSMQATISSHRDQVRTDVAARQTLASELEQHQRRMKGQDAKMVADSEKHQKRMKELEAKMAADSAQHQKRIKELEASATAAEKHHSLVVSEKDAKIEALTGQLRKAVAPVAQEDSPEDRPEQRKPAAKSSRKARAPAEAPVSQADLDALERTMVEARQAKTQKPVSPKQIKQAEKLKALEVLEAVRIRTLQLSQAEQALEAEQIRAQQLSQAEQLRAQQLSKAGEMLAAVQVKHNTKNLSAPVDDSLALWGLDTSAASRNPSYKRMAGFLAD